jgi:hypothetical protein
MPFIEVKITWDTPKEKEWLNPENLKLCLEKCCPNTIFEIDYIGEKHDSEDEKLVEDLYNLATAEYKDNVVD